MPKFLPARSPPSKQDFPQPVTILYCAMCHPVCVKEWNGDGTWRSFRSDVAGQFLRKMPLPPFPPSASSIPLFLPTFECSLSFRAHNHSTVAGRPWSNILRFPGEGLWAITRFSREKRALRRRSASLLPMQCTLSSYLYGSNFGAWLEFQCPIWVLYLSN